MADHAAPPRQDAARKVTGRTTLSVPLDLLEIDALQATSGLSGFELAAELDKVAQGVSTYNRASIKKVLGIDVREVTGLGPQIDLFRERNLGLIRSLAQSQIQDLRGFLESAEATGLQVGELQDAIEKQFQVTESKAELLARDQVLTLNAQITKERQTRAGVDSYIWTTSGDERVREEHAALEGQEFTWISGGDPIEGNPGDSIQCRCVAFPVIAELDTPDAEES